MRKFGILLIASSLLLTACSDSGAAEEVVIETQQSTPTLANYYTQMWTNDTDIMPGWSLTTYIDGNTMTWEYTSLEQYDGAEAELMVEILTSEEFEAENREVLVSIFGGVAQQLDEVTIIYIFKNLDGTELSKTEFKI
ncbi:MAG: hypothetical protein ATN35_00265 [Epulopiscium sp. Nele67-Bin004]|nr:MAG: hypothetical protein ATN35_00265 [Epulopiscium sp. Nele67-Bin004]